LVVGSIILPVAAANQDYLVDCSC